MTNSTQTSTIETFDLTSHSVLAHFAESTRNVQLFNFLLALDRVDKWALDYDEIESPQIFQIQLFIQELQQFIEASLPVLHRVPREFSNFLCHLTTTRCVYLIQYIGQHNEAFLERLLEEEDGKFPNIATVRRRLDVLSKAELLGKIFSGHRLSHILQIMGVIQMFNRTMTAVVGVSVMFSGYAVAADGSLLSQQFSVVANNIKADAQICAMGTKDGTIGDSIRRAMLTHTELAAATPNVESLFDINNDCFSGLLQLLDLSFAVPSLGSIIASAQSAVIKYAQKKICTAVKQVTSMVTSPINQAISKVNGMSSLGDLNGLTNGLVRQGISKIDPDLGAQYHNSTAGGSYTIQINPFNSSQTNFSGSPSGTGSVPSSLPQTENTPAPQKSDGSSFIKSIGNLFN